MISFKLYTINKMNDRNRHNNNRSVNGNRKKLNDRFDDDLSLNSEDRSLFGNISEYMQGRLDINDVKNDPDYNSIDDLVKEMVADYKKNVPVNKYDEKFIKDVLDRKAAEDKLIRETNKTLNKTRENDINLVTAEWVKEWHSKKQSNGGRESDEEIKHFISDSMKSKAEDTDRNIAGTTKTRSNRKFSIRYISLAAAAVLGVFVIVRSLLPSCDTEKLFASYYQPMDAVSPVTRSMNDVQAGSLISAIGSYKKGDYRNAASGFEETIKNDPSSISACFFLGLTQIELNNYNQAITRLSDVVNNQGEYMKEAQWYLGLAYLKTGDKKKASECFEYLSKSEGFYHDRSEKILRRLK